MKFRQCLRYWSRHNAFVPRRVGTPLVLPCLNAWARFDGQNAASQDWLDVLLKGTRFTIWPSESSRSTASFVDTQMSPEVGLIET